MNKQINAQLLAERIQLAVQDRDPAALAALYTEDAILHEGSQVVQGREAIEKTYTASLGAFSENTIDFWNIMTCSDYFIYEGTRRGTHTGLLITPQGQIPPTGRKIEFSFAFFAKMSPEGLIAEDRTYFDSALMMQQLGLG
jgi:predicted ester cyclase